MDEIRNAAERIILIGDADDIPILRDMLLDAGMDPYTPTQEELEQARQSWRAKDQLIFRILGIHLDVKIEDERPASRRVRELDLNFMIDLVARDAYLRGESIYASHGGEVGKSYGRPAYTDAIFAVGYHDPTAGIIHIHASARRMPADYITKRKVAAAAGYPDAFDDRCSSKRQDADRQRAIRDLRERAVRAQSSTPATVLDI